jgi:hypothetical protein
LSRARENNTGLNRDDDVSYTTMHFQVGPMTGLFFKWTEFLQRLRLIPWWLSYNIGFAEEAVLKNKIVNLGSMMGLQDKWLQRILRHAVSEFSKKGLGADYYGYHNIDHELEAAYFTLLSANGNNVKEQAKGRGNKFKEEDIKYLFVAALFHDYDPSKRFDKPHEDAVELFVRNDDKIRNFISEIDIDLDKVIAIIHRTAYPYKGQIASRAEGIMDGLFTRAGISEYDMETRQHYKNLGWFLSVSERIAGYALGDHERSMELARMNAHALGWHPSRINEESVKYFSILKEERKMFGTVMYGVPEECKKNYFENVAAFNMAWSKEIITRNLIRQNRINLMPVIEEVSKKNDSDRITSVKESVIELYKELLPPVGIKNEEKFRKSLERQDTILITLRVIKDEHSNASEIMGYVKGGPLENYRLRSGTHDENIGRYNTAYMEWISIKPGFWGENGGHILRIEFLKEARRRGYLYVSSYVHRNVVMKRIENGEKIDIVHKYDPDKLDYYRCDLRDISVYNEIHKVAIPSQVSAAVIESMNVENIDKSYPIID